MPSGLRERVVSVLIVSEVSCRRRPGKLVIRCVLHADVVVLRQFPVVLLCPGGRVMIDLDVKGFLG